MLLTGKEDLRVIKTIEGIKAAFEEVCKNEMCHKRADFIGLDAA